MEQVIEEQWQADLQQQLREIALNDQVDGIEEGQLNINDDLNESFAFPETDEDDDDDIDDHIAFPISDDDLESDSEFESESSDDD